MRRRPRKESGRGFSENSTQRSGIGCIGCESVGDEFEVFIVLFYGFGSAVLFSG